MYYGIYNKIGMRLSFSQRVESHMKYNIALSLNTHTLRVLQTKNATVYDDKYFLPTQMRGPVMENDFV